MIEPLVSVKMITYNHAPYIARAIESVLRQNTIYRFELVIGEDCSTDVTRQIVFEYQKQHPDVIRVITSEKNVGTRQNSYRTTKALTGKYVAFCEGDDYWHHPDKLQKQVDYLESHSECGLIYSSYDAFLVRSKKTIPDVISFKGWKPPETLDISDFVCADAGEAILTCTVMIRRNLYEQIVESDPILHQSNRFLRGDTQIWAEIAHISSVHFMPESLATYTLMNESVSRSSDARRLARLQLSDAELALYLCDKYDLPRSDRNRAEGLLATAMLRLAFHERNAQYAAEALTKFKKLTVKQWCHYYGAKSEFLYCCFTIASKIRQLFGDKDTIWH